MMNKSRLLHYILLTGLATAGTLAQRDADTARYGVPPSSKEDVQGARAVIWERVEYIIVERETLPRRIILETIPEPTAAAEKRAAVLDIPLPTAVPLKRQDDGQIQALSGQIAQLSISFSSASSASQSISQSAQQVQQSADQASRENSQAISRTQSSASSAVSQASQQANDRIAQASSSMSSQISRNLASVQSSASSVISVMQVSASSSMASAINAAMSQIQAARAEATAVRSDANNFADQVQRNAISTTNLAIIVAVSVSGAVVLTSFIVCIFLRYRRKKRAARDRQSPSPDEKGYDKPIAARGSVSGSRFNPFSGGSYPLDRLKLPTFSPSSARKDEPLNFGFAMSDYSDLKEKSPAETIEPEKPATTESSASFRLQKPPAVKSAEAVRVIRVNSKKDRKAATVSAVNEGIQTPDLPKAKPPQAGTASFEKSDTQVARKPVGVSVLASIVQPPQEKQVLSALAASVETSRESKRYTTMSEASGKASSRYTMISTATVETLPDPRPESKRYTMVSQPNDNEDSGWRPPSSRGNSVRSTNTTAQRLAFRDSGDPVPEADETGWKQPKGGFSMASVSSLMRRDSANMDNRQPTIPKLPKGPRQGASFAAFPTVRNGPPSMVNRPRPALVGKIREDAERRLRAKQEANGGRAVI